MTAADHAWRGDPAEIVVEFLSADGLLARVIAPRPVWHADAACRGMPVDRFFPRPGAPHAELAATRAVCESCPVRLQCLDEALADPNLDHGIRAGLTERARTAHRRATTARTRRQRRSA